MKKIFLTFGLDDASFKKANLKAKRLNKKLGLNIEVKPVIKKDKNNIEIKFQNKIDPGN